MNEKQKNKLVKYWDDESKNTLQLAKVVFKNKFYSHSLFCGHLALEKKLKSKIILQTDIHPPFSHDLLYLAGLAKIDLGKEEQKFLTEINIYQIEGRYPDEQLDLRRIINKALAESILNKIEEFYKWLSK